MSGGYVTGRLCEVCGNASPCTPVCGVCKANRRVKLWDAVARQEAVVLVESEVDARPFPAFASGQSHTILGARAPEDPGTRDGMAPTAGLEPARSDSIPKKLRAAAQSTTPEGPTSAEFLTRISYECEADPFPLPPLQTTARGAEVALYDVIDRADLEALTRPEGDDP